MCERKGLCCLQVRSRGLPDDFEGREIRVVEIEGEISLAG